MTQSVKDNMISYEWFGDDKDAEGTMIFTMPDGSRHYIDLPNFRVAVKICNMINRSWDLGKEAGERLTKE